ncbi:MAG: hypothetical protein HRU70_05990 [Phycisphaeraceae bacterium]|nr:MAG: hypothetical protein HRU70_05990 [Phycisphaeraceae bacterium]
MITPSPTSKIAPYLARGILAESNAPTATKPAVIVLTIPDTSYRIHLVPAGPITSPIGKRIVGTIRAQARRVDVVTSGGRYIEPVFGRPRRVQGIVVATDPSSRSIVVNAGVPVVCTLTAPGQSPEQFEPGAFVSFDVLDGSTFTPESA